VIKRFDQFLKNQRYRFIIVIVYILHRFYFNAMAQANIMVHKSRWNTTNSRESK